MNSLFINIVLLLFSTPNSYNCNEILISIEHQNTSSEFVRTYYLTDDSFSIFQFPYPNLNHERSEEVFHKKLSIIEIKKIKDQLSKLSMSKDFKSLYANLCVISSQHYNIKFLRNEKVYTTTIDHFYEERVNTLIQILNRYAPSSLIIKYDKQKLIADYEDCVARFNNPEFKDYVGNYQITSDNSLSEIDLFGNGTFEYTIRPSFSCWAWHGLKGKYYAKNKILTLIVLDFGEEIEFEILPIFAFPDKIYFQKYQFHIEQNQIIAFEGNESDECEIFIKDPENPF